MNNLLDPAILFFVFGLVAGGLRSNLEIPAQFSKFLSLYLLMALGLKGGFALSKTGFTHEVVISLVLAMLLAVSVPLLGYAVLRRVLNGYDAAALAATYGSVSAVTFITAVQVLDTRGIEYGGHMAAAMALMESPAIVLAVMLANRTRQQERAIRITAAPAAAHSGRADATAASATPSLGHLLREALTDGAQLLLLGSMLIGWMTGDSGSAAMQPFTGDLFKGMLAFFLLDMGLLAARNAGGLKGVSMWLPAYAIVAPLVHAGLALGLATLVGLSLGNAVLLMVLASSASYIAVPAVVSRAIPEASPSLYFGMSLGLTFPLNILLGIPLYTAVAQRAFST